MSRAPLHLATADDTLAARWSSLASHWQLTRLRHAEALPSAPGATLLLDAALPALPPPSSSAWRERFAAHRVVYASALPSDEEGLVVIQAGCAGYCHAFAASAQLAQVLSVVASGELWVGRSLLARLLRAVDQSLPPAPPSCWQQGLTEREAEVARQAAGGASNLEIAGSLGIAERTVKAHLSVVFDKLGVADRLQLALRVHGIKAAR